MKRILSIVFILSLSMNAIAGKEYTKGQLNAMVNRGEYPAIGRVLDTQTKSMSFSDCRSTVDSIMSEIRGNYPVETIANTGIMYMVKAWTNDGAIITTCSKPDFKLVITVSEYR